MNYPELCTVFTCDDQSITSITSPGVILKRSTSNPKEKELLEVLQRHGINVSNICIVGGYVLELDGIRRARDIDFIMHSKERAKLSFDKQTTQLTKNIDMLGERRWHPSIDNDLIIQDNNFHQVISNGLKVCKTQLVIDKKQAVRRPKDIQDLRLYDLFTKYEALAKSVRYPTHSFTGCLWASVLDDWSKILEEIGAVSYYIIDPTNNFRTILKQIYLLDDADISKVIDKKLPALKPFSTSICFFKLLLHEPNYRTKRLTGKPISTEIEKVKSTIRHKYQGKVVGYVHDIIIHIADNTEQSQKLDVLLNAQPNSRRTFVSLPYLLTCNMSSGPFNRSDMLVRFNAIQSYVVSNTHSFDMYKNMQRARQNISLNQEADYVEKFKRLIDSIIENGFDPKYPIKCSKDYKLVDGSHRLALAYYLNLKYVPVQITMNKSIIPYDYDWFVKKGFNREELIALCTLLVDMFAYLVAFYGSDPRSIIK